jgi:hypothetical protein
MAGLDSRFLKAGYDLPKYMLRVCGAAVCLLFLLFSLAGTLLGGFIDFISSCPAPACSPSGWRASKAPRRLGGRDPTGSDGAMIIDIFVS